MAVELELKTGINTSKIKAVNSQAKQVDGIARNLRISLGEYEGRVDLLVIEMDDFDLILGNAFLSSAGVGVFPQLGGLLIMDKTRACFVRGQGKPSGVKDITDKEGQLATMWLAQGNKPDTLTDLAKNVLIPPDQVVMVPEAEVLEEHSSVLLDEWENLSLPEIPIKHQIEVVHGESASMEASVRMLPSEFTELEIQPVETGDRGKVQPSVEMPILIQGGLNEVAVMNHYHNSVNADLCKNLGRAGSVAKGDLNSRCWQIRVQLEETPRNSREEHRGQTSRVMNQFRRHQLGGEFSLRMEKFLRQGDGQVRKESKVQTIAEWMDPTEMTGGSFLGEASKKLTHGDNRVESSATDLLHRRQSESWRGPCNVVFKSLETTRLSEPISGLPDLDQLETYLSGLEFLVRKDKVASDFLMTLREFKPKQAAAQRGFVAAQRGFEAAQREAEGRRVLHRAVA